jgi:hypothetical protein
LEINKIEYIGELEIKELNVAGMRDLIIDLAVVHEFQGNVVHPDCHGNLRHPNPDKVLTDKAVAKAQGHDEYRPDYLRNHNKAFLPLIMSTSGRLHGEFVRLLYLLAHRRAVRFFATLEYEPCGEELRQRRGASFFQHLARIGLAGAQAAALCTPFVWAVTLGLPRALASGRSSPLTPHFTCLPSPTTIFFCYLFTASWRLVRFCFCFVSVSLFR